MNCDHNLREGTKKLFTMDSTPEIVKKLRAASDAYYNTGKQIMSDDDYDTLRDLLAQKVPNHPFLREVGASPTSGAVKLPYIMASLNKIKPGTGSVESFVKKRTSETWVTSEKLDGISALWYKGRLYLRGNGETGVDITQFAPHMKGLVATDLAVRGELIVPRGTLEPGTLARSWVNGQLHQKVPIVAELSKINFLAYEICASAENPSDQFKTLRTAGFLLPWNQTIPTRFVTDEKLGEMLQSRRSGSVYDTDGIVVAENITTAVATTVKNPTTKMAFKMLLDDQCAETTIQEVEWNASAHGYLIPRLRITPVVIGTARIEFVTAHNAKFVVENKLAPGAVIKIKRSGDVIPAVETVVRPAAAPKMPEGTEGTEWKWGTDVHLVQVVAEGGVKSKEVMTAQLVRFAAKMELVGLGPGVATKLADAGLDTPGKLFTADVATLTRVLGKALGPKIAEQFIALRAGRTEIQWMVASNMMPRGVGDTKLTGLFAVEADPRKWSSITPPSGWSADSLQEVVKALPAYEAWRRTETALAQPYPILTWAAPREAVKQRGTVCFTGVRDKQLEADLEAAGYAVVDSVTKTLSALVVPDGPVPTTGKAKKATDLGLRVLGLSSVRKELGV